MKALWQFAGERLEPTRREGAAMRESLAELKAYLELRELAAKWAAARMLRSMRAETAQYLAGGRP